MDKSCKKNSNPRPKLHDLTPTNLKSVKISIQETDFISPIKTDLESPERLKVHFKDYKNKHIFSQSGIVVNKYEVDEEYYNDSINDNKSSDDPSNIEKKRFFKNYKVTKNYKITRSPSPLPEKINESKKGNDKNKNAEKDEYNEIAKPSTSGTCRAQNYSSSSSSSDSDTDDSSLHSYRKKSTSPRPRKKQRSPSYERRKYQSSKRSLSPRSRDRYHSKKGYETKSYSKYRSPSPRPSTSRFHNRSKSRSRSPYYYKRHAHKQRYIKKYSRSPGRSPPLRPDEYRPPRKRSEDNRRSRSPKNSHPKSPESCRCNKKSKSPPRHKERSLSPSKPFEYRPECYKFREPTEYTYLEAFNKEPIIGPLGLTNIRPIFGQIFHPPIQYIPAPQNPPIRPYFIRPPLRYNNRTIPRFLTPPPETTTSNETDEDNVASLPISEPSQRENPPIRPHIMKPPVMYNTKSIAKLEGDDENQ